MSNNQKQRSATERLQDLEDALTNLYQVSDNMARDLITIKEAIKLLGNKVDSIVQASASGQPVNDEVISSLMVQNNVNELKSKVDDLVARNIFVAEQTITEQSFVVGRETDEQGNVVNPRIQFALAALGPEVKEKLLGAQPGQTVAIQDGKLNLEVLEIFTVQTPSLPQQESPAEESASS